MKPVLLIVRPPAGRWGPLRMNYAVRERWKVVSIITHTDQTAQEIAGTDEVAFDFGAQPGGGGRRMAERMIDSLKPERVVIFQPLFWYSEEWADVCRERGVPFLWAEGFVDWRITFDAVGCAYTADNEIARHVASHVASEPDMPVGTKFDQPGYIPPGDLLRKYGVTGPSVALFAQVEADMSLVDTSGGLDYKTWLLSLVMGNPSVTFLVKEHPLTAGEGQIRKWLGHLRDVRWVNESIFSLCEACPTLAAYSSTVIFEGTARTKRPFITGGHHFLNDPRLCVRLSRSGDAGSVIERARGLKMDEEALSRYTSFITNKYALRLGDPRVAERLSKTPEEYYAG